MSSEAICLLTEKLDTVIERLQILESERRAAVPDEVGHVGQPGPVQQHNAARNNSSEDCQGEFVSIRDTVTNVKLPAEVRLNDASKQGVRRNDHPQANVLIKCARYAETILKLLAVRAENSDEEADGNLESIFKVTMAQMKYIQDEYAGLLVQGTFDSTTSKLFKSMQKNSTALSPHHIGILQSAATISAAASHTQQEDRDRDRRYPARGRFSDRGYYRFGYRDRASWNRSSSGDSFQRLHRGFTSQNTHCTKSRIPGQ